MNERISEDDPRLTAYALGELERGELAAFERLLDGDARARAKVDEIRATAALLEGALESEAVAVAATHRRARQRGPIIRFPQFYYIVSGLAAACFAVMFMIDEAKEARLRELQPTSPVVVHQPPPVDSTGIPDGAIAILPARNAELTDRFVTTRESSTSAFPLLISGDSYARVRAALQRGEKPRREQVRVAEMINAFNYAWPAPSPGHPFSTVLEAAPAPWAPQNRVVRVGLKGHGDAGALLARDARVEVDFNSERVKAWRLIGFERNGEAGVRGLSTGENLRGDAVVTALYEVVPVDGIVAGDPAMLTLSLHYSDPASGAERTLAGRLDRSAPRFEDASQDLRFIASIAAFGFLLKDAPRDNAISADQVGRWATAAAQGRPEREEFLGLVEAARAVVR